MSDLTREQIEQLQERSNIVVRRFGDDTDPAHVFVQMPVDRIQALCAMALRAIDAGWQPMETAPRDGTMIIVTVFGRKRCVVSMPLHPTNPYPYLIAWMPLPPPFTGDPDARRTVAATGVDGNGTGKGGE